MNFYSILQQILEEKGLSIAEAARICGVPDSTLRSIIKRQHQTVALDVAMRISLGLGVSLEQLNGIEGEKEIMHNAKNSLSPEEEKLLAEIRRSSRSGNDCINHAAIGKRIKEKRKEAGLNQKELATKVGLSEASVSKYENGKIEDVKHNMLIKFADALGVSISWLLGVEKQEASNEIVSLSEEEKQLINDFRSINRTGKDYILQTMQIAAISYNSKN